MIEPIVPQVAFKPSEATEEWLTSHGVEFTGKRIQINDINTRKSLQNQARFQPLDEKLVVTYAEAMQGGDRFPPIVVLDEGLAAGMLVIDGNHRVAAATLAGADEIDAYVTTNLSERTVSVLTFDANTKHGLPTSPEERKQHAIYLVETAGISQREASQMLNVPARELNKSLQVARANRRLAALDIERWQNLGSSMRERLQSISNNNVFKVAAELAIAARLSQEAINELVTDVNKAATEADQIAVVEAERERQSDRIKATIGGRATLPKSVMRLSRSLAYAERVVPEDFEKRILDPKLAEAFSGRLRATIDKYAAILDRLG